MYIPGLGLAAPIGKFSYLSNAPVLEFRESESGPVLVRLRLKETVLEMGVLTGGLLTSSIFRGLLATLVTGKVTPLSVANFKKFCRTTSIRPSSSAAWPSILAL